MKSLADATGQKRERDEVGTRKRVTKRTAEMTVETDEILYVSGKASPARPSCRVCQRTPMISPEQAARMTGVNTRAVYAWVGSGKVHFVETPDGALLICSESLTAVGASR